MEPAFYDNQTIWVIYAQQLVLKWWQMKMLIIDTFWDSIWFLHNTNLMMLPWHLALYHKVLFWVFLYNQRLRHQFRVSKFSLKKIYTIFCNINNAFFLTKSVVWVVNLITESMMPLAMTEEPGMEATCSTLLDHVHWQDAVSPMSLVVMHYSSTLTRME